MFSLWSAWKEKDLMSVFHPLYTGMELVKENKSVWKGSQMGRKFYSAATDLGKLEK